MKDILHFSHANGFPASTYRRMFAGLADEYEVRSIERIGHDARFPITRDWPHLVEQLLDDIGRQYERPVWLVGHSLGGYLSLMAALERPEWVRGVVMIDSPILAGWRSAILRALRLTGLDERWTPAGATRTRRAEWPDRASVWRHFRERQAFADWHEDTLSDYIDYGVPQVDASGRRALAFDREIEYRIYKALPETLGARLARDVAVPVGFLAGRGSRELRQMGFGATRRIVSGRLEWLDGSHLFPMEKPFETACAVKRMLARLRDVRE